jgi:prophage maintenance system killer protein
MEENKIIIYQTEDGQTQIDVRLDNDMVWLTQAQMAELFQKDRTVITRHINNVFKEGELSREEVCAKFAHTTRHGAVKGKKQIQESVLYNLDVIISVGYRVKSKRGTAMLLYLVTKNHSFSDGNKRIAATLFLWFLNNNGILYRKDGTKRLADNTLVALTLMIAESKTEEKDVMVKVVVNLINQRNE